MKKENLRFHKWNMAYHSVSDKPVQVFVNFLEKKEEDKTVLDLGSNER